MSWVFFGCCFTDKIKSGVDSWFLWSKHHLALPLISTKHLDMVDLDATFKSNRKLNKAGKSSATDPSSTGTSTLLMWCIKVLQFVVICVHGLDVKSNLLTSHLIHDLTSVWSFGATSSKDVGVGSSATISLDDTVVEVLGVIEIWGFNHGFCMEDIRCLLPGIYLKGTGFRKNGVIFTTNPQALSQHLNVNPITPGSVVNR